MGGEDAKKSTSIYRFGLDIVQKDGKAHKRLKSYLTIVDLCSSEYLFMDFNKIVLQEGLLTASTVVGPYKMLENSGTIKDDSVLTKLLTNEIGGNCKTVFLLNFDSFGTSKESVQSLRLVDMTRSIRNYPIVNTEDVLALQRRDRLRLQEKQMPQCNIIDSSKR
ncbi:hypothetical protein EDD86DRAFT_98662 [Gorgonomyces haynaldii]|nr:hypothetical protein EDD86DRAFT_98662 [Gorgonomyces haynaldii]